MTTTTTERGIRFEVQKVDAKKYLGEKVTQEKLKNSWETLGKIEAISPLLPNTILTFDKHNMLARAVHDAFYGHYRLCLSPDVIWMTIAQGFANHVNENAEKLRNKFVNFEEKKEIVVERPEFVKGSPNNDWVGVFPEFCDKIEDYIGEKTRKLLEANFSTTGVVEKTVSQIVLMDAVKAYFKYILVCGCGIPSIELTGKPEDWMEIRAKFITFNEFELGWWVDALLPILDQFVSASQGKPDLSFWTSICNLSGGSGMRRPINGWIQSFFPYLLDGKGSTLEKNNYLNNYAESIKNNTQNDLEYGLFAGKGCGYGVKLERIPTGISKVPFLYIDLLTGNKYDMFFCGGVTCCVLDSTEETLEPKIGWAIIEEKTLPPNFQKNLRT